MLTKEQNRRFSNIIKELNELGDSLCKEGEVPFIILDIGVISENGVSEEDLCVGDSNFYIRNTTPDIIMLEAECLSEESQKIIDSIDEAEEAVKGKDSTDINTWIGISKDRLN